MNAVQVRDLALLLRVGRLLQRELLRALALEVRVVAGVELAACALSMCTIVVDDARRGSRGRARSAAACRDSGASQSSSHSTASRSRWLVGSSSSSRSERHISACARLRRMRQPPEKLGHRVARGRASAKPEPGSSVGGARARRVAADRRRSGRAACASASPCARRSCGRFGGRERRARSSRSSRSPSSTKSSAGVAHGRRLLRDVRDRPAGGSSTSPASGVQLAADQREEARLAAAVGADEARPCARGGR